MHAIQRTLSLLCAAAALSATLHAQDKLKDGTSLTWNKTIGVGQDSLMNDTVMVPARTVPIYEADDPQVAKLLEKVIPGSSFKKQGKLLSASDVVFPSASDSPVQLLASIERNKKENLSLLKLAFLQAGAPLVGNDAKLNEALRDLGVKLNKAVVQEQIDDWNKQLDKAGSKAESATKASDKTQGKLNKSQSKVAKASKERSKLQGDHAVLQKEIDLLNQKWTLSQDPKDLKKLTKARGKITKNESKMAKAMKAEADAQKDVSKYTEALPDAQKTEQAKAATQAEVQRTVDALQRKMENIR